ncbi:hypothetical protein SAMN02949497_0068 [Methylomagnum ishizawai]|uniref:Uncharacterized protein n=1 Tax=Methylomagnum ishizawai TaxID=1760988 RepID=A0A1Y6DC35_9GAMM|nr:hypothetical protein [Methylomagnum ishizawai]SMF97802.1 hypothetical protein SAMN02949497_0068 [Methylomagnum ishizawai]
MSQTTLAEWLSAGKDRLRHGLSRSLLGAGLALFALLAALEGLAAIIAGGYGSLRAHWPPWLAGGVVGGLVILAAALALWWAVHIVRGTAQAGPPAPVARPAHELHGHGAHPAGLLGAAAAELIGENRIKARDLALMALVAGIALGVSPGLRRQVFGPGQRAKDG